MKKITKAGIGLAAVAAVATTGAIVAFAWGPDDRPTYTMETPADHVTFNSITNNNVYGDERYFMMASSDNGATWHDTTAVENGKEYLVRMYVHNNAASNLNLTANDVKAYVSLPTETATSITLQGQIHSSNAEPEAVWDETTFTSANGNVFNLAYVDGSTTYANKVATFSDLGTSLFTNAGQTLGYDKLDGNIPGCNAYSGVLSFKVRAQVAETPKIEISKEVKVLGTDTWSEEVQSKAGETVRYRLTITNTGDSVLKNVTVRDILPEGLTYVKGSVSVANANHPTGIVPENGDDIMDVNKGLGLGAYGAGSVAYVYFNATVNAGVGEECNDNRILVNTAQAEGKTETGVSTGTVEDTANVVIGGKICTEGFHIDKMVQLDGEKDWHESVKAKPGERIKFRIRFFNDGETALNNVVIADNLPAGLVYEADTLEVYRGIDTAISRINPVDANLSDNNVTVNVDKVAAKEVIYTYFYAHSNGDLAAECGDEKSVTNTVKGKYNNDDSTEQTDTADVIVVTEVCEEKNPGFIINKMVQLDGGSDWYETVTAKAGEKIRYRIQFKNTGETTLENVVIRDIIPANVNYVAGTTILYNAKGEQSNPGDGIVSTDGIKIGTYNPGEEATIYFYATVSSSLDECADYTFTNVVKGKYNNDDSTEKSDTADVTVNGVVCTPPELPKTGAGSIVSGVLGLASVSTAAAYYVASRKKLN